MKSLNDRDGGASADGGRRSDDGPVAASPGAAGPEDGAHGGMVEEATSNVYAVRVKRRLAMERCEILRLMIQLEEDEEVSREDCENGGAEVPRNGEKRKHDSIEN